ncbi:MAG: Ldh family oxidoreductase [Candidatus Acidiferrales bacterium]|jgi:LDH2 family malate/lactate/ureidoglycolate dehydrogenase
MTIVDNPGQLLYVRSDDALEFARQLLLAHGVPPEDSAVVAEYLIHADLRGVDTHGLIRLPLYLDRIRRGLVNPRPDIKVCQVTPVSLAVDGENGLGQVVATRAMNQAIAAAKNFGCCVAGVKRSTHFGVAASYALQAIHAGLIGMVFTNASASMPPWGGRQPILGTSPLAVGAPGGKLGPFVLDMSVAVAARGKIRKALRRGESIPEGYALDAEGRPTTDPAAALQGLILPMGGPKGSGLAMVMDIFGGVLTGAAFAGDVGDQTRDFDRTQNVGHFLFAMRPDLFVSLKEYEARMDTLIQRIHDCPPAEGFSEVLIAGEFEARQEVARRARGLPYSPSELATFQGEAAKANLPPLIVSDHPLNS